MPPQIRFKGKALAETMKRFKSFNLNVRIVKSRLASFKQYELLTLDIFFFHLKNQLYMKTEFNEINSKTNESQL